MYTIQSTWKYPHFDLLVLKPFQEGLYVHCKSKTKNKSECYDIRIPSRVSVLCGYKACKYLTCTQTFMLGHDRNRSLMNGKCSNRTGVH